MNFLYFNLGDTYSCNLHKKKVSKDISDYLSHIDNDKFIDLIKPGAIHSEFTEVITNTFIKTEFELFMGYASYQRTDTIKENYRNGSHSKTFKTSTGDIKLSIPEDRNSDFYQSIVNKYQNKSDELVNSLIELFKLGLSNKEIVNFMENVYGSLYSHKTFLTLQKL